MSDAQQPPPRQKQTLIEDGTEFKGTMSSNCPTIVMGKIEGDVSGPSIQISTSGTVAGTVKVKELRSEGELAGNVDAEVIHLSGRVRDSTVIRASSLEVVASRSDGAMEVVFGECELAVGDEPNKDAAVAAVLPPRPGAAREPVAVAAAPAPSASAPAGKAADAPEEAAADGAWDGSSREHAAEPSTTESEDGERSGKRGKNPRRGSQPSTST